jgi:hypothetical protein
LAGLTTLSPELQAEFLGLRSSGPLGQVTDRTVFELCAARPRWNVQRWWWSLLRQPFEPKWLAEGVPVRLKFPSGAHARRADQAIGDVPLPWLVAVAESRGHRHTRRREDLLAALADTAAAPIVYPDVALVLTKPSAELASDFERGCSRRRRVRQAMHARRSSLSTIRDLDHDAGRSA